MPDTFTTCPACGTQGHHLITGTPGWQRVPTKIDVPNLGVQAVQCEQIDGPEVDELRLPRQCTSCGHAWGQVIDTQTVRMEVHDGHATKP